jgi:hypothetical protein
VVEGLNISGFGSIDEAAAVSEFGARALRA